MNSLKQIKPLVRRILETTTSTEWNIRTNGQAALEIVPGKVLINIFDPSLELEGRNYAHTHKFGFRSLIIAGCMCNTRFVAETHSDPNFIGVETDYEYKPLRWTPCCLKPLREEIYVPGDAYEIRAYEIHRAEPQPGTVTFVQAIDRAETITAYWPYSEDLVKHLRQTETEAFAVRPAASDRTTLVERVVESILDKWTA